MATEKTVTKLEQAKAIFVEMSGPGTKTKDVLARFQADLGMSAAAASTYFYKIKNEKPKAEKPVKVKAEKPVKVKAEKKAKKAKKAKKVKSVEAPLAPEDVLSVVETTLDVAA